VSPPFVRGLARYVVKALSEQPSSAFLKRAYFLEFPWKLPPEKPGEFNCNCFDHLLEIHIPVVISVTWLHLLGSAVGALACLRYDLSLPWFVASAVSLAWAAFILITFSSQARNPLIKALQNAYMFVFRPLWTAVEWLIIAAFRAWYRAITYVHKRGAKWSLSLIGLLCVVVATLLQLASLFR